MIQKKLLAIHLNEFNFDYLKYGVSKYKLKYLKKLISLKKISTYTKDKTQNKNLDPWVQSVSINIGKTSRKHKIFKLGQKINKKVIFIWDILIKKNIDCYVWGSINTNYIKNKYLKLFFPDPWNYASTIHPKDLKPLHILPRYYAKNYLEIEILKTIKYSFIFFYTFIKNNGIIFILKHFSLIFRSILSKGLKNYILFFIFDLISLDLLRNKINSRDSCFSYIFLNSLAHFQHNNWNDAHDERYYFLYVEKISKLIFDIYQTHNSLIVFNGFSQKRIKNDFLIRPINPIRFLKQVIKFSKLEQDMTNGGFIFFKNKKNTVIAFEKLKNYKICGIKIFEVSQKKSNSFFYRIIIRSNKDLKQQKNLEITKKIFSKSIYCENKKNERNIKFNSKELLRFIKSVQFIKTTGIHSPHGDILFDKLKNLKKKISLENHKIFNIFKDYFS